MSEAIDWDLLQKQYTEDAKYHITLSKECHIIDKPKETQEANTPGTIFF